MKRILFLCAVAMSMVACGQKDNTKPEQPETNQTIIPPGMPVAPTPQIPSTNQGLTFENSQGAADPNTPVLQLEEGKPLDFSQLQGGGKTVEEQVASQIDSIRYKAEHGDAKFQYAYGVC